MALLAVDGGTFMWVFCRPRRRRQATDNRPRCRILEEAANCSVDASARRTDRRQRRHGFERADSGKDNADRRHGRCKCKATDRPGFVPPGEVEARAPTRAGHYRALRRRWRRAWRLREAASRRRCDLISLTGVPAAAGDIVAPVAVGDGACTHWFSATRGGVNTPRAVSRDATGPSRPILAVLTRVHFWPAADDGDAAFHMLMLATVTPLHSSMVAF